MTIIQLVTPTLGESTPEATVGTWRKSVGDSVARDEVVVELETDKIAIEVVSPDHGTISKIVAEEGDIVAVDQLLAEISPQAADTASPADAFALSDDNATAAQSSAEQSPVVMPAAMREVERRGGSLEGVVGTGRDGRILKEDVAQRSSGMTSGTAPSTVDKPPMRANSSTDVSAQSSRRVAMSPLRRTIAARLKGAQETAAMLTTFNDVDMTAILELRRKYRDEFEKKHAIKLGFMGFFVKAAVAALQAEPALNAEIDGNDIVYHNHINMGVAVGTPRGLVVPVIRNCQNMSLAEIEQAVFDYGVKAKEGKIALEDMKGGTFTLSNGGVFGSLLSTPILNAPQSGIVGMHRTEKRAVVNADGNIVARDMMYLALTYDHRIVDGREAVTFLVRMKQAIEDPQRLLLEV